jgi:trimeric autotransporter adhesin
MADLFNQQISATYSGLLKTSSSGVLSASLSQISDGRGNTSPLYLSTDSIQFYGAYSFPNADGSANQVLKTDGAGVLTWENDSLSNTLNFSGGTGTGSVTLDTQTLAFTGTANEIVTSASSQAITLSFPTAGVTLPNGSVATTQTASDNSTKVATTAYVDNQISTAGTVTSVALSVPTGLTVTGSPITTSGTITIGGTLGVANGGTGATTLTGILVGNGTSAISTVTDGTVGQVLSTDGSGTYSFIDAGTGDVTVDGASVGNRVAVWNNTTGELRATSAIATENSNIYLVQPSTNGTDKFNYIIGGAFAINENDFGTQNTGFGHRVLNGSDLTGGNNSAFGMESLYSLTTGSHNTSIGSFAMHDNRSGNYNVGLGTKAMFNQRISNYNVAIGYDSMDGVTASQTAVSDYNTAVGYQSLQSIQGGDNNTVIGKDSGNAITTGSKNVIIGSFTGTTGEVPTPVYSIIASSNNIVLSDGDGNVRQSFDSTGTATFSSNVGIGTSSPNARFSVVSSSSNSTAAKIGGIEYGGSQRGLTIKTFQSLGGDDCGVEFNAAEGLATYGSFVFKADTAERLRISSGGDVGIGTDSPRVDQNTRTLQVGNTTDGGAQLVLQENTLSGGWRIFNNGYLGFIADNSERMRITSTGEIKLNNSTTSYPLNIRGATDNGDMVYFERVVSGTSYLSRIYMGTPSLYIDSGGSGGVVLTNGATAWTSASDINLKKDIVELSDVLSKIKDKRCISYRLKSQDFEEKNIGFIAQDWQEDFPQVVKVDERDETLGITYTETIPILLKAIQEQQTIIEDLKSRIETLEG